MRLRARERGHRRLVVPPRDRGEPPRERLRPQPQGPGAGARRRLPPDGQGGGEEGRHVAEPAQVQPGDDDDARPLSGAGGVPRQVGDDGHGSSSVALQVLSVGGSLNTCKVSA
ncbi:hypothetical protein DQ241_18660 [Blastococcus sp. TF02A-30]|nr:hypothetical protein DQ241_18660 [Blastococcus sp. TF02A-30]